MEKTVQIIFNPGVARNLLRHGCKIVDIKPNNQLQNATVFCFEKNPEFDEILSNIKQEIYKTKNKVAE